MITLPTDSVSLDGSSPGDPDGSISNYLWPKISGPASFTISNASVVRTVVKNLVVGSYQFELKVTDNGGFFAKDTMRVIVDSVVTTNHPHFANAGPDQTIALPANPVNLDGSGSNDPDNNSGISSIEYLHKPAWWNIDGGQNAVVKDNKIIFGGSYAITDNKFDICDLTTNSWSIGVFPVNTEGTSIISVNNIIYIAGGKVNGVWSNQVWRLDF